MAPADKSAGEIPPLDFDINISNKPNIYFIMPKNIQKHMHALIVQHGSALATFAALWQHPEAQQNDEQTDFLENHVPHINVPAEFIKTHQNLRVNIAINYRENGHVMYKVN